MVFFLILWILVNGRAEFLLRLKDKIPQFRLEAVSEAAILTGASAVLAYAHSTSSFRSDILLNVFILLFWYEGTLLLILPDAGKYAFRYLALYAPTSLVQYVGSIFFDAPISQAFLTVLKPIAESTGWPVQIVVSRQFIDAGGNGLMVFTGSAGLPAISVFLLLAGLVYLDVRPRRRIFLVSLGLGLLLTVVLNMLRILILIWIAIVDWASWDFYHSILGYIIFSIFYVAFVVLMSRPGIYRRSIPRLQSPSSPSI